MRKKGGGRDCLTFGMGSYLAVGLLFGLTLPGVSAHGFLGGRVGRGKGLYSFKETISAIVRETRGRSDRCSERGGRRQKQTDKTRKREIECRRHRSGAGRLPDSRYSRLAAASLRKALFHSANTVKHFWFLMTSC